MHREISESANEEKSCLFLPVIYKQVDFSGAKNNSKVLAWKDLPKLSWAEKQVQLLAFEWLRIVSFSVSNLLGGSIHSLPSIKPNWFLSVQAFSARLKIRHVHNACQFQVFLFCNLWKNKESLSSRMKLIVYWFVRISLKKFIYKDYEQLFSWVFVLLLTFVYWV